MRLSGACDKYAVGGLFNEPLGSASNAKIRAFEAAFFLCLGLGKKKSLSGTKKSMTKKGLQESFF